MSKPKILIQLDSDVQPSVFDGVVAVDAGVDHLFQYGAVMVEQVQGLVHGAMFTRGPGDLHNTAVFIGGSDVTVGEAILKGTTDCFFGPLRVSVMMDASGANTTSAAAVVAARRHLPLAGARAVVLAATGPVGQRVTRLLAAEGAHVKVASRNFERAEALVSKMTTNIQGATNLVPVETSSPQSLERAVGDAELVIAAGAAGVELMSASACAACQSLRVAIDLNAVPPSGIAGVEVMDKARDRNGAVVYGAIGIGGTKMKIHKAAIHRLFTSNDAVLDIDEIYRLGLELDDA